MNRYAQMISELKTPEVMKRLTYLYGQRGGMLVAQSARYSRLLKRHEELVGYEGPIAMVSAPGRTEIGGNHTDHNRGKVLAAAVNLDTLAAVSPRADGVVNIHSEGYAPLTLSLDDLSVHEAEKGTTAALVRGVADGLQKAGLRVGGFDAVITSTVRSGSGLSSSAAVEVLLCAIFDEIYNEGNLDFKRRAQISQYAENVYFGKPSGLMDQMASSAGGLVYIDFQNDDPEVETVGDISGVMEGGMSREATDKELSGGIICDGLGSTVAACFGETYLRRVQPEQFMQMVPQLRERLKNVNADRAILRAAHYFAENRRVADEVSALQADDLNAFLRLVIESGRSSFCYLQNIFATPDRQELSLALMLAESKLHKDGAWRVHGGGFAGTTLNFVPKRSLDSFVKEMEAVFGAHSCNVLDIRPVGPACIRLGL